MLGIIFTRRLRANLVTLAGLLTLAGCGSDESAFVEVPPGPLTETVITGSIGDGPVTAASIVVTNNTADVLAEFQSDMSGGYSVTVEARDTQYPLIVSATGGTDLVTNMVPDFEMLGAVIEPGTHAIANVNPLTTLIIELARDMDGGLSIDNIRAAEATVLATMDTGLVTMRASGPLATPVDASNISEVVRASEVLAEIVRRTRDLLVSTASVTDAGGVIRAIGSDLTDGVIEGNGGPRSDARTAAVASIVSAQVLLESMASQLHVNGIDATDAMRAAIAQVSPGMPEPTLDELTVTAGMINTLTLGIAAALAVDNDPIIAELAAATEGLQAGMDAALVTALLPAGYRQTLDSTAVMVANGDDTVIEAVNSVVRNGGTPAPPSNSAPTISGSPPNAVSVDEAYAFTPTASDADGDALTFGVTNLPGWASFDTTSGALTGTPTAADAGSYLDIVIEVSDGSLSDSLGPFSISVVADNQPPVISGSGAATILVGEAYSFTPTASDAENDPLTFSITNGPSWASLDATTGTLSGTPAAGDVGSYPTIIIRVSDGDLTTSLNPFTITVTAPNTPPTIGGTPAAQATAGSAYSFTPTANDADGDSLTYSIAGKPDWASFSTSNGQLSGTPDNGDAGTYSNVRITVTDGTDSATLGPFSITVTAVNTPPTISGSPPNAISVDEAYAFTPTASDADGDALTFSVTNLPGWASFDTTIGALTGTPTAADAGSYLDIVIEVSDGSLSSSLGPFSISVVADNQPPVISGSGAATILVGEAYSFTPTASDAENDPLTFSITNGPSWASLDATTGTLSGTPAAGDVGSYPTIIIRVSDGDLTTSLNPFTITVTAPNTPPTIGGTPAAQATAGSAYSFTPTANDADGDSLTYSIAGKPDWASFSTSNGQLSGTPDNGDAGTYSNIRITVTDGTDSATLGPFSITVTAVNTPPTISGSPPVQVTAGGAYSFTPTANDADGDALTFSINGQPSWASFNTTNGRLSGTPDNGDAGTYSNIRITVSDSTDSATLGLFSITVTAANTPPTIGGSPPGQVTAGSAYSFTPTANDADGDALTFSINGQPSWASFNTTNGRLSGTPDNGDAGTYSNIHIMVTDGTDSATLGPFSITVTADNTPPTIGGSPPSEINVDSAYSFTPTASDADGDSLTFSVTGKPAWASFDLSNGQLSGTPVDADVGTYSNIRITVTDGTDSATLGPFSITVNAVSLGSVTLTWDAPTRNVDGTPLTDLAAYRIYWGTTPGLYPNSVRIDNPGMTTYVLENLAPGTYEFVATAINSQDEESRFSDFASITLQ